MILIRTFYKLLASPNYLYYNTYYEKEFNISLLGLVLLLTTSATCSSNDNEEESSSSSLTLNGSYVKNYSSVTGEWDGRSTAVNNFSFWVNGLEVLAKEDGI